MKVAIALSALALTLSVASWADSDDWSHKKAVFVMTNSARENEILSFQRQANGSLQLFDHYSTGGRGSGGTTDPLGSQGSLTLSQEHSTLFAVNAGSGTISVFSVNGPRLHLEQVAHSHGSAPVAVAQHDNLVYVLNFAGDSNVVGFHFDDGQLTPIKNSIHYLSTANSGASSLAFSPDGNFLVVTEKLTNNIDVFPVMGDGTLGAAVVTHDAAAGLFAVTFAPDGALLAVETGGSTISSYLVEPSGMLTGLSTGVPTMGAATCWHVVTPDGQWVYTSNSASSTISGYTISGAGTLTPLPGTIVATNAAGTTNLDVAVSGDGKFLYALDVGNGTIGMFSIGKNGALTSLGELPAFAAKTGFNGIAAL